MMSKRIPIAAAKRISQEYGYDQVVIHAVSKEDSRRWVTTYGRTKKLCKEIAPFGDWIDRVIHDGSLDSLRKLRDDLDHWITDLEKNQPSEPTEVSGGAAAQVVREAILGGDGVGIPATRVAVILGITSSQGIGPAAARIKQEIEAVTGRSSHEAVYSEYSSGRARWLPGRRAQQALEALEARTAHG